MEPHQPRTKVTEDGVLLVLDNGVRIESKSPGRTAGAYVLVADADGHEIGYWNAEEWRDEPEVVMGAILILAARGVAPAAPEPEDEAEQPSDGPKVPAGVPFVIDQNDRQFLGDGTLKPLTEVGPKKSGALQEFEPKDKK